MTGAQASAPVSSNGSVENQVGGNPTYGTITAQGLYAAPAVIMGHNPVLVTATSTVQPLIFGSVVYALIMPDGPNLTGVSPHPLPTGAIH